MKEYCIDDWSWKYSLMKKSVVNKVAESGMGHLAILMWIKMNNNQNTFACLEFLIFGQKIFLIFFLKRQNF